MEFTPPDFVEDNSVEDIHERMMANLPEDIDDTPGGFPYDMTMPSAIEKSELIEFHLVRALMIAFPQFAWDEWLDMHGQQVHITRHEGKHATGILKIEGEPDTEIEEGTVFMVPATEDSPAIEFKTDEACVIGESGVIQVGITAIESGADSNVKARSISIMEEPVDEVTGFTNPEAITGGTATESDDDYYDRIATEYENSRTFLGSDADYIRWAQEAGAGDCIVDAAADGLGTVKLVLVDQNGQPATEKLLEDVYNYIVSPNDRKERLLPTACAKLICVSAKTVLVNYECHGLQYDETTSIEEIKKQFEKALKTLYVSAKIDGVLRYNSVRPLVSSIDGVKDFEEFLLNGAMTNIQLKSEEYPETGSCDFD